jgi:hypothetical protein
MNLVQDKWQDKHTDSGGASDQSKRARSVQCAFAARFQGISPAQFASAMSRKAAAKWMTAERTSTALDTIKKAGLQRREMLGERRPHTHAFPIFRTGSHDAFEKTFARLEKDLRTSLGK